jgi:hypothetical protein
MLREKPDVWCGGGTVKTLSLMYEAIQASLSSADTTISQQLICSRALDLSAGPIES